jgi:hypothetical protein
MESVIDISFSDTVKAIQARKGSRQAYQNMADNDSWGNTLTADHRAFIAGQRSFYLATANAAGQPYMQHRGGPPGFLNVIDDRTLAFADFRGNRQFVSQGNLSDNPKAFMFLMDYTNQRRLKIWGEAHVVEDDEQMIQVLMPENYKARPEQAIYFRINLLEFNCRQHIPMRFEAADVAAAIQERDARITELEAEIKTLKGR